MDLSVVLKGDHRFALWLYAMLVKALNEFDVHYEKFLK